MAHLQLGNVLLRTGIFSWWSWAASFALLPAYLSYGGWGGQYVGSAPEVAMVVLAALLGIGLAGLVDQAHGGNKGQRIAQILRGCGADLATGQRSGLGQALLGIDGLQPPGQGVNAGQIDHGGNGAVL